MRRFAESVREIMDDPRFWRVCLVLWSAPFIALGLFGVYGIRTGAPLLNASDLFMWGALVVLGLLGVWLVCVGLFGPDRWVGKIADAAGGGAGDFGAFVFIVLTAIAAVPLTALLRVLRGRERERF